MPPGRSAAAKGHPGDRFVDAHHVAADAAEDRGRQGQQNAAIDHALENGRCALLCRRARVAECVDQCAAHANRGPDDAGAKKQRRPDIRQVIELHHLINRPFAFQQRLQPVHGEKKRQQKECEDRYR